jgi:hypothetical protein
VKFYNKDVLWQICIFTTQENTAQKEKFLAWLLNSKQDYVKRLEALPKQF